MDSAFFIKAFGGIFAIMNPFLALPVFLSLTEEQDPASRRRTALAVTGYALALSFLVAIAGARLLSVFGVGVQEFRVAGGIVVMLIGLQMLNGTNSAHAGTPAEQAQPVQRDQVAFYPMAFPMIVGPGTIATIVLFTGQAKGLADQAALAVALVLVLALTGTLLWFAGDIGRVMSQTLRTIVTRLMGMILVAIAVTMLADGLKTILPGLA
ncbi:MAG: MarC family protein [Rhodobacteraceae bacterium]|nr:MarC family protein [Paracoccaceae bacterium]